MTNSLEKLTFILALSLFVSGCELMGPKLHEKMPLEPVDEVGTTDVIYQELSNHASDVANREQSKTELYPGTGAFYASQSDSHRNKGSGKGEYSLNFDDADLGEVAKVILSDILSENYVLSPKVTGRVTLQTSNPLTRNELLPTLEMLLQINNAGMVYQDGLYQIQLRADALNSSAFTTYNNYRKRAPAGSQIRVVPIRNVAVEELAEIIRPLLKDKTILQVNSARNLMLLAGTAIELNRAMDMVNTFDVDVMKGRSFGMFPVKNVEATILISELEQIFNKDDSASSQGFFQFLEIERLNSILAITHRAKSLKDIERWVLRLDRANTTSGGGAVVYRVQHVDAVDLAATLNEIFSQSGQRTLPASVSSGREMVQVTNKNKSKEATVDTRENSSITAIGDVGEINIIADEVNNALIIVATAQDYAVVQKVIKQLDVMPLQVLIDATIVDVTLDDELQYGIKWFFNHGSGAGNSGGLDLGATASTLALAAATGGASEAAGFGYSFISQSQDIKAVLNAEAIKGNVNVISSPSLMVLNNQEASIQVGEERSLRTSESTNTSGGATDAIVTNTIQQRKTGVTVNVRPRVNANGLVILEIEQSIENFSGADTNGNPNILTREIKSTVAVQSGETIVLGGLISERNTYEKGGLPVLHELPLIGPLFGNTSKIKQKTELVLLITPRVVMSKQDARLVTDEFRRKLSGIYELTEE